MPRGLALPAWLVAALTVAALGGARPAAATILVPDVAEPKQVSANVTSDGAGPEVVFDGTRFFVVWHTDYVVQGAFLSTDGDILSPGVIEIASSDGWRPSVSYDGTNFLVAWRGGVGTGQILAKRVSAAGTVLDSAPIVIVGSDVKQRRISVAFDGTRHLAVWRTEGDQIRGARISTAGAPLDGASGFLIGGGFYPWVESAGGKFLVVWHGHGGASGLDVYGSLVTNGTPAAPFTIADDTADQDHVSVATNVANYMVAFKDARFGDTYNFAGTSAVRVQGDGTVLDDPPIKVSDLEWKQGSNPTVAWDGTDWVVAWPEDKPSIKHRVVDTYARRISTAGAIVDADPVPLGTGYFHQLDPTIAVAGNRYLAAIVDRGRCVFEVACLNIRLVDRVPGTPATPPAAGAPHAELGTWTSFVPPTDEAVHGVAALSDDLAYASTEEAGAGYNQNPLLRWNGTAWSVAAIQPNARKWSIWAPAENHVFTAGGAGGSSVFWNGTTSVLGAGPFIAESKTFLGQAMAIHGFGPWSTISAGMAGGVARHVGTEQSTWTGSACLTLDGQPHTDWGRFHCDHIRAPLGNWDLAGLFPSDVYVVGEYATMARFDGTGWNLVSGLPTQQSLNALYASCAGDLFAVGDFGTILRRQGGTWSRMGSPTTQHLSGIAGFSPTDVYAVGTGGTILHFDGTSWSPEASGTTYTLEDVAVGGSTVWAVGTDGAFGAGPGTILRKQRTITDAATPQNPSLRSPTHAPGVWTSDADIDVVLEGGCDDGRGIDGYSAGFDQSAGTVRAATINLGEGTLEQQASVPDGEHYFHLRTVDQAGNWSATSHLGPLRVDTAAPTNPTLTVEHPPPGTWSSDTSIDVSWSGATDTTSGVAGYSYAIDGRPDSVIDTTQDLGPSATGIDIPHERGIWYLHLRTVDHAGNWSQPIHAGPLQLDDEPPTNPPASFVPDQSSGAILTVEMGFGADPLSGIDGYSFAFDRDPSFTVDTVKDHGNPIWRVQSPSLAPGDWYFKIRTVDNAGNWSASSEALGPLTATTPHTPPALTTPLIQPPSFVPPPFVPPPFAPAGASRPVMLSLELVREAVRRGTRLAFTVGLNTAAQLTLQLQRAVAGRRQGGRCRATTVRVTRRPRCTLWRAVGAPSTRAAPAGRARFSLPTRTPRGLLPRGRYRLEAFATNPAGRSRSVRAPFVVR